ncbi:MAG TPA: hypothetical protein PK095_00625 [Myxococcota bacterium]|nr:hypothetical protein [Myxococcota bacterium]
MRDHDHTSRTLAASIDPPEPLDDALPGDHVHDGVVRVQVYAHLAR